MKICDYIKNWWQDIKDEVEEEIKVEGIEIKDWLAEKHKALDRIANRNFNEDELFIYNNYKNDRIDLIKSQIEVHKDIAIFIENPTTYREAWLLKQRMRSPYYLFNPPIWFAGFGEYSETDYNMQINEELESVALRDANKEMEFEFSTKNTRYFESLVEKWVVTDND